MTKPNTKTNTSSKLYAQQRFSRDQVAKAIRQLNRAIDKHNAATNARILRADRAKLFDTGDRMTFIQRVAAYKIFDAPVHTRTW